MFIVPLLFILLLVLAVLFIFRIGTDNPDNTHKSDYRTQISYPSNNKAPIEILKDRYARGEVTEEEFVRIKKNLES